MKAGLVTDIDGFTVNEKEGLATALLQRREYNPEEYDLALKDDRVLDSLFRLEGEPEWKLRYVLSEILKVPFYLALWPKDYPLVKTPAISEPVIVYEVKQEHGNIALKEESKGDTKDLETLIFRFRGRSFSVVKPLTVGMTMMECYLASKTGVANPWPGNLDAVVWNEEREVFSAIIEFKTHNYPQYPISTQYFGQWGIEDTRRYRVLDILQKHIAIRSSKPKFVFSIWGTDKAHTEIKLQTIDDLKTHDDKLIRRPDFTDSTTKDFTQEILKYIYS